MASGDMRRLVEAEALRLIHALIKLVAVFLYLIAFNRPRDHHHIETSGYDCVIDHRATSIIDNI